MTDQEILDAWLTVPINKNPGAITRGKLLALIASARSEQRREDAEKCEVIAKDKATKRLYSGETCATQCRDSILSSPHQQE